MSHPERFPPSEYLADELTERGWTITYLAERAHLHTRVIEEVLSYGRPITPLIAGRLALALDTSPDLWLNLQRAYDEDASPCPERVSPAEYLADTMRWRGWMIDDLAVRTHLHPRVIEEVINNGRPITPRIAGRLAPVLGTSPDLWLNLQRAYDKGADDE